MPALQSIFHVAFLRGLFPDNYFKGTSIDNLEGEHIACRKADLLSSESTSQPNCMCNPEVQHSRASQTSRLLKYADLQTLKNDGFAR